MDWRLQIMLQNTQGKESAPFEFILLEVNKLTSSKDAVQSGGLV
jgi:hypothetical protein